MVIKMVFEIAQYFIMRWRQIFGYIFFAGLLIASMGSISGCAMPSTGISGSSAEKIF